ncbi:hypothetical protein AGABI1DRAFT_110245 [Agaricus bisporus var. burnettii JB137-S8]|uniref:Uncharacterized protein n=1 Tax=Agaricus bisporus var. burnettii (strain JB137-S8 / ATCC MYA-4627 / FGSC 10392) TaxID=597362 RepID=K5X6W2_AGABU|nr:uncharacterized protein AGABI1DRAFT_110245 [Agaricus bisporus var. burnettii JB137-S8]EKM83596.1 hypothetical protein AGABI1DRAFT_110245 [Agaricus bisporus var. burnettii JB137-S8]
MPPLVGHPLLTFPILQNGLRQVHDDTDEYMPAVEGELKEGAQACQPFIRFDNETG